MSVVQSRPRHISHLGSAVLDTESPTLEKIIWRKEGEKAWVHKGYNVNYIEEGDPSKPPLLLIHGFGASAYHFRYNIPDLAKDHHVFAMDMIGFGLSDKPVIDYNAEIWRDQVLDFIENVVRTSRSSGDNTGCVVAGNSLGGFTALYSASASSTSSRTKNLISGCILLNAAGRFRASSPPPAEDTPAWQQAITDFFSRLIITASFYYTKQPARIAQVLRQVYVDGSNVDDELVESIEYASRDPNAAEVFYRIISRNGNGPPIFIDDLLLNLQVPLLLLWGEQDPWIRPLSADRIQTLFPAAERVNLVAGHCPHDEVPGEVNKAIREFIKQNIEM
eukprot:CAMPEP_0182420800 /NCGR_PEP_ID=MMETSP1167-20130531/5875_1 /TAXON_ID=2988 /ORGANISM="Mallomonas Sp, Strain CCMP3275" /LENGTH=333 /DNA_ID=CAMNT_0024597253 /DNA_START=185 /DNA_END=1190 /DNA_ORIENTATION=+